MVNLKLAFVFFASWATALNFYLGASIEVSLQKGCLMIYESKKYNSILQTGADYPRIGTGYLPIFIE